MLPRAQVNEWLYNCNDRITQQPCSLMLNHSSIAEARATQGDAIMGTGVGDYKTTWLYMMWNGSDHVPKAFYPEVQVLSARHRYSGHLCVPSHFTFPFRDVHGSTTMAPMDCKTGPS